ncbi:MAG: LysM domain-containing protein [Lachnospiraceae bacterium]|nr:LysM domain-containing protein [Lachnospiraceae bacterium]
MELPKNIRQIGENDTNNRIYIEDYVITYLQQMTDEIELGSKALVLLGKIEVIEEMECFFIYGAICSNRKRLEDYSVLFESQDREYICEQKNDFFGALEIIGFAVIESEFNCIAEDTTWAKNIEGNKPEISNQFQNENKIFCKIDASTKEKKWKLYKSGIPKEIEGYAIFYDKNEMMQNYLVQWHKEQNNSCIESVSDKAARKFRSILIERQEENYSRKMMPFFYILCATLMIMLCIVGVTTLNNYDKMIKVENSIQELVQSMNEKENESETGIEKESETENMAGQAVEAMNSQSEDIINETDNANQNLVDEKQQLATEESRSTEQQTEETQEEIQEGTLEEAEQEVKTEEAVKTEPETKTEVETNNLNQETSEYMEYYVQEGDTLAAISFHYYTSIKMVDTICQINNISNPDSIMVGEKILLP